MRLLVLILFLVVSELTGSSAQDEEQELSKDVPPEVGAPPAAPPADYQPPADLQPPAYDQPPADFQPPGDEQVEVTSTTETEAPMPKRLPNWGYEPYWYNGNWAFKTTQPSTLKGSPFITYKVCGDPCSYMIQRLGKVCVRYQHIVSSYDHCQNPIWSCRAETLDNYAKSFHTLANYCIYLDIVCLADPGKRPLVVHLGECVTTNDQLYKPIQKGWQLVSRKDYYLDALKQRLANIPTTTRFNFY